MTVKFPFHFVSWLQLIRRTSKGDLEEALYYMKLTLSNKLKAYYYHYYHHHHYCYY